MWLAVLRLVFFTCADVFDFHILTILINAVCIKMVGVCWTNARLAI